MALSHDISIQVGTQSVAFPGAYVRVSEMTGGKNGMTFVAQWHESADGAVLKGSTYGFIPDLSGPNFIAQAYLHLKSLPEFAGATDC
jgi:hypothetical protein